jgi:hypothetical protein
MCVIQLIKNVTENLKILASLDGGTRLQVESDKRFIIQNLTHGTMNNLNDPGCCGDDCCGGTTGCC